MPPIHCKNSAKLSGARHINKFPRKDEARAPRCFDNTGPFLGAPSDELDAVFCFLLICFL